jgi:dUTP pyrophosphatase
MTSIPIIRLPHAADMELPSYATAHAAGLDLMAALKEPLTIEPGKRAMIPTGIAIALPVGFEAQVRPRSGLAAKHGITILNSPGTIDSDYRGEIKAILINLGDAAFVVEPNARIAQLIVAPVIQIRWETAESLPETVRGEGGFGSTGLGQTGA